MNWKLVAVGLSAVSLLAIAACGESQKVTVFKQGTYQGKPDNPPWNSPDFKGDKNAWENAISTRTMSQNEYVRIGS